MKFFGRSIRLGDPQQADVVIFDECNHEYVKRVLNTKYSVCVFKMRPYEILIGPTIIVNAIRCSNHFHLNEALCHPRGFAFGVLFQLRAIYFEACIISMKPKAVITMIDNSAVFHWLSRHSRGFPYMAIQNGSRLRYAITMDQGYYLQHYFCWGTHEPELFNDLGYKVENFYPVGSLLASLYFKKSLDTMSVKYDVLIISTWRGDIGYQQDVLDTMESMRTMDLMLAQYLASRRVNAAIALRAERDSEHWIMPGIGTEYDYYREIYGDLVEILEADFSNRTIYQFIQQSKIIVSCLSSALNEAYGLGKKIMYFNYTNKNIYHCDIDPRNVSSETNFYEFCNLMDSLASINDIDYQRSHGKSMARVMSFPPGDTTYRKISHLIDEIITAQ